MAPFDIASMAGSVPYYLIFLFIGVAFGAVLELSGFGDSRKLAAQFYLRDMTVLKVMFTAIIVAAVLISTASAAGLLDISRISVNTTYLVPGITGGLIMGVGFIVGGFCPGTSVVAASTFKLDGLAFIGGVGLGTLLFSETASLLGSFKDAAYMGRFTLDELFGLPVGVVVILLVFMAVMMFYGAEIAERYFGRRQQITLSSLIPGNKLYLGGVAALFTLAAIAAGIGQPSPMDKWESLAAKSKISLNSRDPYIHPAEVVEWRADHSVYVRILDVRDESDYNRMHLAGAMPFSADSLADAAYVKALATVPANTLSFVTSNDEAKATAAWKQLVGSGVPNVYIIEGGMNNWLKLYPPDKCIATPISGRNLKEEELAWSFSKAVGDNCYAAHPEALYREPPTDCYLESHPELKRNATNATARPVPYDAKRKMKFKRKVKMQKRSEQKSLCG